MSEEIALAIADGPTIARQAEQIAELERQLATALAAERYWRERHHEAWVFVGELSYILQFKIAAAKMLRDARAGAKKALRMIDDRTKGGKRD